MQQGRPSRVTSNEKYNIYLLYTPVLDLNTYTEAHKKYLGFVLLHPLLLSETQ